MWKAFLDPLHPLKHALGMTVCGIHDEHVYTRLGQRFGALVAALTHADGRTYTQTSEVILAGVGVFRCLDDIFDGDQSAQFEIGIHHQHSLQPVLVQQRHCFFTAGTFLHCYQTLFRRHDVSDGLVQVGFKTQVPVGDDADHSGAFHYRQTRDLVLMGEVEHFPHCHARRNGDRVFHHAAFEALDLGDMGCLRFCRHILVDDADAALLGKGNGKPRLGNRIHGG